VKKNIDKDSLLNLFKEKVASFSEDEINNLTEFFSKLYANLYIHSKEDAFEILLEQGLPKALKKLNVEKRQEIKQKFLSL